MFEAARSFIRRYWFFELFFFFLFGLLFLGDGKASYINVVGAAVVIIVCASALLYRRPIRKVPITRIIPWCFLLGYLTVVSFFSIDVGTSIETTARYISAFVVYYIWHVYSPKDSDEEYAIFMTAFGGLAVLVATVFAIIPSAQQLLPSMNLIWSNAGHNHVTDIILLTLLPSLFVISARPWARYIFLLLLLSVFVLSQARAALAIALLATAAFMTFKGGFGRWAKFILLGFIVFALSITFLMPELGRKQTSGAVTGKNKSSILQERRGEYWRQAILATQARPIFGFGPGTFYLLSDRFQSRPMNSSWFAHNYVLEIASETGIVGLCLFLWVIITSYVRPVIQKKHASGAKIALLFAPAILFVYGLVDFSLNYYVVWLLLWATIGFATRNET